MRDRGAAGRGLRATTRLSDKPTRSCASVLSAMAYSPCRSGGNAGYSGVSASPGRLMCRCGKTRAAGRPLLHDAGYGSVRLRGGAMVERAKLSGLQRSVVNVWDHYGWSKNASKFDPATGVGLHTGKKVMMDAQAGTPPTAASASAAWIWRLPVDIRARAENVGDTTLGYDSGAERCAHLRRSSTCCQPSPAWASTTLVSKSTAGGGADHGRQRRSVRLPAAIGRHRAAGRAETLHPRAQVGRSADGDKLARFDRSKGSR